MKELPLCPCQDRKDEGGLWPDCRSYEMQYDTYTCGEGMERNVQKTRCQIEAKLNKHD